MSEILSLDAVEQARLIASGALKAERLMEETLSHIAAVNPALNAIVSPREPDACLAAARAVDRDGPQGPLAGLPIAIKDLIDAQGLPTTQGSPVYGKTPAAKSHPMVARLEAAGALVIGKTNTPEFGLGSHTFNPVHGVTANPYDHGRTAGGSSGGAAVALAARMVAIADGSDMMGSLRNPAGWNNIYGFRPSVNLVHGDSAGESYFCELSTLGPMARSPADLVLMLQVQAARDPRLPHNLDLGPVDLAGATFKGKRLAWLGDWGGALPYEAGVLDTCEAALAQIEALGARVDRLPAPFPREALWQSWTTLRSWQVAAGSREDYADPLRRASYKASAKWEVERGLKLTGMEVHAASELRSAWFAAASELFDTYDAFLLPTAQCWPFPASQEYPEVIADVAMDTYHRWMECVVPASLIGLPALAVPAGFGAAGLPMGLQIVGRQGRDAAILALGQAWHRATHWPQTRPPAF